MDKDLEQAKEMLVSGEYTCVLCKGAIIHTSTKSGVIPLIEFLDSNQSYQSFAAADKVVGKAAAYLYIIMGVQSVYALVMSKPAFELLCQYNIAASYKTLSPEITNRNGTGCCPMDHAVQDANSPENALIKIKQTLQNLTQK
ncbi:MAG TPA: DUF1893 domain-containing protein [Bacillota bacterium]|jgi:hypothetical protein|nr:DUF1893 domain-containing protein [Bacillota bacterium]HOL10164.1 DUF1893 domain-containing protein [Bacillota bacterium]HPO97901.1 DUF1893 domain-containing protein [Bacillota bacterium]